MTIKAILFGSIGTIIETSDIQRNCFNQAFQKVGLNWHWSKKIYKSMLKKPGGEKRVRKYSLENNTSTNAKKIRNLKTLIFNNGINTSLIVYDMFKTAGYDIAHLDNTASKKERARILNWFKVTPGAILTSVSILTTGFDEPTVESIILNRATKSLTLYLSLIHI